MILPPSFYTREDVVQIAQDLLGCFLMTYSDNHLTGGMIIETEAYKGAQDKACHAYKNKKTARTEVMFSTGGVAYIYLCYGMHHLFNIVTHQKDIPEAVLIRAIQPTKGIDMMMQRRQTSLNNLSKGPGTLTQALAISKNYNGTSLQGPYVWVEQKTKKVTKIQTTPRIGVNYAEEDALLPYRFVLPK